MSGLFLDSRMRSIVHFSCGVLVALVVIGLVMLVYLQTMPNSNERSKILKLSELEEEVASDRSESVPSNGPANLEIESLEFEGVDNFFEWCIALDEVLASSQPRQLNALLQQSRMVTGNYRRSVAQESIVLRFADLDPLQALKSIDGFPSRQRDSLARTIVANWAIEDLDSLIEHLTSFVYWERENAFQSILKARNDLTSSEKREIGERLGLGASIDDLVLFDSYAAGSDGVEESWYSIINDNRSLRTKRDSLLRLAGDWVKTDGVEALSKIAESIPDWRYRQSVFYVGLRHAARLNPQAAFEASLNLFGESNWDLIDRAAMLWVERDAEAALKRVSSLESNTLRQRLYESVVRERARVEPRYMLENLEFVPNEIYEKVRLDALGNLSDITSDEASRLIAKKRCRKPSRRELVERELRRSS